MIESLKIRCFFPRSPCVCGNLSGKPDRRFCLTSLSQASLTVQAVRFFVQTFYVAFISLLDVLSALYLINIRKLKALLLLVASVCWFQLLVFLRMHPRTDANTSTIGSRNRRALSCFVTLCSCFEHCHVASSGCCATLCISLGNPLLGVPKVVGGFCVCLGGQAVVCLLLAQRVAKGEDLWSAVAEVSNILGSLGQ